MRFGDMFRGTGVMTGHFAMYLSPAGIDGLLLLVLSSGFTWLHFPDEDVWELV